jgi:peptidoglycan/xylan/chitin deacetylase (PgdA/CDA1 family)
MSARIRSLMFHDVVEDGQWEASGFSGAWSRHYKFTKPEFDAHLAAIQQAWTGPPPGRLETGPASGVPLLITFDDGGSGSMDAAAALEKLGWRGYFFITTGRIGQPGFLDAEGIRELAGAGHIIGSHSVSHPTRMAALSRGEMAAEWRDSLASLTQILGTPVEIASVPGGHYSRAVGETAAEAGIRHLFNSEPVEGVEEIGACRVYGRYAIHRGHTAADTGAYAGGSWWTCGRTRLWWNAKKAAKAAGGPLYLTLGRMLRR